LKDPDVTDARVEHKRSQHNCLMMIIISITV